MKNTIQNLRQKKITQQPFSMVAAYDATFSMALNQAGIASILVGDSLGMVVQGQASTLPVTIEQMVYHTEAVASANLRAEEPALIIADLPFMSYATTESALTNAAMLMRAGANMVKLEGGSWLAETVAQLGERGIPVCGHIGLTPQSVNKFGGFKVQGRLPEQQKQLIEDAQQLDRAGADFIVLECIPKTLASTITSSVDCSTVGIGAGNVTDAQVLVCYDILGLSDNPARFVKNFISAADSDNPIVDAFRDFKQSVEQKIYPAAEHEY